MKKYIVFALILAPLAIFAAANSYNINFNSTVVSGTSVLSTTVRYTFTTNIPDAARYTISISCLPSTQGSLNASFGEKYIRGEEACRSSDMPINYDYLDVTYYGGGTTNAVLKVYSATGELLGTSGSIIIDVSAAMTGSQIDGSKQILIKTESSDLVTPTPAPATAPTGQREP